MNSYYCDQILFNTPFYYLIYTGQECFINFIRIAGISVTRPAYWNSYRVKTGMPDRIYEPFFNN